MKSAMHDTSEEIRGLQAVQQEAEANREGIVEVLTSRDTRHG